MILSNLKEGNMINFVYEVQHVRFFNCVHLRCLLPVKPSFAASVGIIRGYSRSKKTCYVEPSQVSENNYKLTMLKDKIEELEKSIVKNLISRIINESPTLWRAIYLLGRLGKNYFAFIGQCYLIYLFSCECIFRYNICKGCIRCLNGSGNSEDV